MTFHEDLVTPDLVDKGMEMATRNFETQRQRMEATHSTWKRANANHSLDGKHISEHVNRIKTSSSASLGKSRSPRHRCRRGLTSLRGSTELKCTCSTRQSTT